MIFPNGYVRFYEAGPGGGVSLDPVTGFPAAAGGGLGDGWGARVLCQYVPQRMDNVGRVEGERFRLARWEVFMDLPRAERRGLCRLEDRDGRLVAEGEVIAWERLEAVAQVRMLL